MEGKRNLLLINPPPNAGICSQLHMEHLGLGYLAASVRRELGASHRVRLWDFSLLDPHMEHLERVLAATTPHYAGLSLSAMNADSGVLLAEIIHRVSPSTRILVGGILASSLPTEELLCYHPDAIIRGEGEVLLPQALAMLDEGTGAAPLELTQAEALDVDTLAWPSRDMLPWQLSLHPQASISASRGCPFNCGFCSIPQPGGKRLWRPRHIEDVVEEMAALNRDYGAAHFYFVDDNFLLRDEASRRRAARFAELVLRRLPPVRFGFMCRSAAVDTELFALLKRAGLAGVFLGIESFSQAVLDRYHKAERVEEHHQALTRLATLGITVNPGFIFFDPWTDAREMDETLAAIERMETPAMQSLNSKLTCYRGSRLEGKVPPDPAAPRRRGIQAYRFLQSHTKDVFQDFCTLFYRTLPAIEAYATQQRHAYALAYVQPFLLLSRGEKAFLSCFKRCQRCWKKGDDVVVALLRERVQGERASLDGLGQVLRERAAPFWREGNALARRTFNLADTVLRREMEAGGADAARLAALAYTSPQQELGLAALLRAARRDGALPPGVLADALASFRTEDAGECYAWLLSLDDDAVALKALRAALRTRHLPILELLGGYLERNGETAGSILLREVEKALDLCDLDYPGYVLAGQGRGGLSSPPPSSAA